MITKQELERLAVTEKRVKELVEEWGLPTADIIFEIVPVQRMLEGMAYNYPTNFSHWSFGRDYEKYRTIWEHTGHGIPYEQVWNLETPRALIVNTSPFALKVLTMAHVFVHVAYFLLNRYLQRGREFSDIAAEARNAVARFHDYENRYGREEVEKTIDAGMSICWQQHPDPFIEEELDLEEAREKLLGLERAKLEQTKDFYSQFKKPETEKEIKEQEKYLRRLANRTPPWPIHDLLGYIIRYSPILRPWQKDVLTVIRNQARALGPNRRTKMLNEGFATCVHTMIMRKLAQEGLITNEEHGVFNDYHSQVTQKHKAAFNWYAIGSALFEYIKERWDRGMFGPEYDECKDPLKKAYWDTKAGKGWEKILEVVSFYSDRMAIEEFFTDDFIRMNELYFYEENQDPVTGDIIYVISEDRPEVIRNFLKQSMALYGIQPIVVKDANFDSRQELYLVHQYYGLELEPRYRDGTLGHIFYLWGRDVHIETVVERKQMVFSFDGIKPKQRNAR